MLYTLRHALAPWFRRSWFGSPRLHSPRPAPAESELPNLKGHVPALDAIRGLAIVLVTLYRFGGGDHGPGRAVNADWLVEPGSRGVDLFFVLSGFLITGILFDAKGKAHYFRNFYVRRSLRIFPLYYGVLAATVFVLPLLLPSATAVFQPAIDYQAWLWLYGANVFQSWNNGWCLGPFNHFWSLAVEEHFYLLWPLLIFCTSRQTAMRVCLGLIAASTLGRIVWLQCGGNAVAIEVLTPLRMDGLALGSWIALAARSEHGLAWLVRWARPAAIASGLAVLGLWLADKRLVGVPFTLWSCLCGSMLVLTVAAPRGTWLGRLGNSRVLRFFGKYSYAMYVFQNPLIPLMAGIVTAPGLAALVGNAWLGQAVYCALMFALTTLAALASWQCFEKHWLALKERFGG
jgi:peptidoglycan/LPS O-acetylase OafA/YrhL